MESDLCPGWTLTADRTEAWTWSRTRWMRRGSSRWRRLSARSLPNSPGGYGSACCLCTGRGSSVKRKIQTTINRYIHLFHEILSFVLTCLSVICFFFVYRMFWLYLCLELCLIFLWHYMTLLSTKIFWLNLFIDCSDSRFRRRGLRWHCRGQTATCWCSWLHLEPPPPPPSYWPTPQNNDKQLQTKGRQSDHIDEMIQDAFISSSLTNNKDFNWNTVTLKFFSFKIFVKSSIHTIIFKLDDNSKELCKWIVHQA